ncbi:MAG: hypothetical protein U0441_27975 [Polyangiaceae bacterium]
MRTSLLLLCGLTLSGIGLSGVAGCGGGMSSSAGGGGSAATGGTAGSGAGNTAGSGTGGTAGSSTGGTGGTGGSTPGDGACPTGKFPADKQIVFETSSSIDTDTTWTKDNLYIVKGGLTLEAQLTIEAGTTVCFDNDFFDNGAIHVAEHFEGGIHVAGTQAEHVTLTAVDPAKGWDGVHVFGYATQAELSYTDFYYGSRPADTISQHFTKGAFHTQDAGSSDGMAPAARLDHVSFYDTKQGGTLWLLADAGLTPDSVVTIGGFNLFQDDPQFEDPAVIVSPEAASSLTPGMITLSPDIPESKRGIELLNGTISADATIHAIDIPYFIPSGLFISNSVDKVDPVKVTFEAGVEVRLGAGAWMQVGASGAGTPGNLVLDGTAEKPVKFVHYPFPYNNFADNWGGIVFERYDPAVSRISHAILENGGLIAFSKVSDACGTNSSEGVVLLKSPTGGGGSDYPSIAIDHTAFNGSYDNGIVAECSIGCIDPAIDYLDPTLGNTFTNIAGKPQILATCPP